MIGDRSWPPGVGLTSIYVCDSPFVALTDADSSRSFANSCRKSTSPKVKIWFELLDIAVGTKEMPVPLDRIPTRRLLVSPNQSASSSAESARILVADDDRAIRESLERVLGLEHYQVTTVADGAAALESARSAPVDLIVLDLMMPSVDGLTVCRVLRSEKDRTPILMLTARTETSDRVAGLDAGADDYLAKPFDPAELMARVRALLRRALPQDAEPEGMVGSRGGSGTKSSTTLIVEDLRLDASARRCWRGETEIELSKTEFDLLELLMFNTGIVLSRSHIYEEIWDYDFGPDSKNLAVYISYLRRKVDDGQEVALIQTVRGVGYTLRRP